MKRIIALWLSGLLLAVQPAWAGVFVGFGGTSGDYCTGKLGSYSLYYDADHPSGTTTVCVSGGTTTVTEMTGISTSSTAMNMTSGGTYGVEWDGLADHYLTVPSTGLSDTSGRVELKIKFPSTMPTANFAVWEWGSTSEGGKMFMQYSATGAGGAPGFRLGAYHYDGTSANTTTAYIASSSLAGSSRTVLMDWSGTSGYLVANFDGNNASVALTVTEFSEPENAYVGEKVMNGATGASVGFDDYKSGPSQQ